MTDEELIRHPYHNPDYFGALIARKTAQRFNRNAHGITPMVVPKLPNRYIPHTGAKEKAKHAAMVAK